MQAFQFVCVIFITSVANYLPKFAESLNGFFQNNEQFGQSLHHITFFNIFFEEIE